MARDIRRDERDGRRRAMPTPRPVAYRSGDALPPETLEQAEKLAERIGSVPASQLRRFFGDVTAFDRRLELERDLSDTAVQAQMGLLKARAAYARARVGNHDDQFPEDLLQFFVDHASSVKTREDFAAFRQIFETLVAYHKFHENKGGRG